MLERLSRLGEWLKRHDVSQEAFAEQIGCNQSHVSRLARGLLVPDLSDAFAIERETAGEVPADSWTRSMPRRVMSGTRKSGALPKVSSRPVSRRSRSRAGQLPDRRT